MDQHDINRGSLPTHPGDNVAQVPNQSDEALRRVRAGQAIGYRIMRSTEVAPSWWGKRHEVGETVSAAVANNFCDEQNAVTMDPNRAKRIQFSVEPIYSEAPAPVWRDVTYADAVAGCPVHRAQYTDRTTALDTEAHERAVAAEERAHQHRRTAHLSASARAVNV